MAAVKADGQPALGNRLMFGAWITTKVSQHSDGRLVHPPARCLL